MTARRLYRGLRIVSGVTLAVFGFITWFYGPVVLGTLLLALGLGAVIDEVGPNR